MMFTVYLVADKWIYPATVSSMIKINMIKN